LIKENKEMLPPKKLIRGEWVKEINDGGKEYCFWLGGPGLLIYFAVIKKMYFRLSNAAL
jgi:hypothetical protein